VHAARQRASRLRGATVPELPDLVVYLDALQREIVGRRLERVQLVSPFVLRSVDPPIDWLAGRVIRSVDRVGKRLVFDFGDDLFLVIHLMIAGRLKWFPVAANTDENPSSPQPIRTRPKILLAIFEFSSGSLSFTEAGSKKRASMQVVRGAAGVRSLDPGGVEPLDATLEEFRNALTRESHTLKRALTDPHLFSGIGNAYSDEILHAARLSPLKLTRSMTDEEVSRLHQATRTTLLEWIERLRSATGGAFPGKVTAFRPEMAVHGRFKQPCPVCAAAVQRIVYAENECNYCARCQTGGRLLADRSLSRLLKSDWPRSIDDV
jgi:formamidopyrimidine-DNA glycosylase